MRAVSAGRLHQRRCLLPAGDHCVPRGPADWLHYLAFGLGGAGLNNNLYIRSVKPSSYRPLASFRHSPTSGSLVVNAAEVPIPLEPADWRINYVDHNVLGNSVYAADGRPFVAYVQQGDETDTLKCAWSQVPTPANDEDWTYYVLEEGSFSSVGAVSISGLPIVAYRDYEDDLLRFGFYDE